MLNGTIFCTNRYLMCVTEEDKKTATFVMIDEGNVEKNCDRFYKLIACLGREYIGYTVIGTVIMSNGKIATITTTIM